MQKEKYGFVYIWRDKGRNRFYLGAHWGSETDGYICSSKWMSMSRLRRPNDFKRRILSRHVTKDETFAAEYKLLQLIKDEELGTRYYNKHKNIRISDGPAWNKGKKLHYTVWNKGKGGYKISEAARLNKKGQIPWNKGKTDGTWTEARRASHKPQVPWNKGKTDLYSEETRSKMGWARGKKLPPRSDETKQKSGKKNAEHMKRLWADPEYRKMMLDRRKKIA